MKHTGISPLALGLSLGVIWSAGLFIMGLLAQYLGYGAPFVSAMGVVYLGYAPNIIGSIIGALIGFVDAFIAGFLIGWLYNFFSRVCSSHPHH